MKVFPAGSAKAGCLVLRFYERTVKNTLMWIFKVVLTGVDYISTLLHGFRFQYHSPKFRENLCLWRKLI